MVDAQGRPATWTGEDCVPWAGHRNGPDVSVQGNMLVGQETVEAMFESFAASADETLPERLMLALEAGQAAGGDKRGKQSAGFLVFDKEAYPHLDLRVDEHHSPVAELRRVYEGGQAAVPALHDRHADPGQPPGRPRRGHLRDAAALAGGTAPAGRSRPNRGWSHPRQEIRNPMPVR